MSGENLWFVMLKSVGTSALSVCDVFAFSDFAIFQVLNHFVFSIMPGFKHLDSAAT